MVSIQLKRYIRRLEKQEVFDMSAIIKVNGKEIPEGFCIVDTLCKQVEFNTVDGVPKKLDYDKVHAEVNIYGDEETILSKF